MAQWLGQFTGRTHFTKVKDLEETLSHALDVFRTANSSEEKTKKGEAVQKLAAKLLTARLKLLKAKLYDTDPVIEEKVAERTLQIEHLQQQIEEVRVNGVNGILIEFGVQDLCE